MQGSEPAASVADDGTGIPPDMVAEGQEGSPPAETTTEPSPEEKAEQDFARRLGWRPKEEFRGPEHKWVDHKQFIDKTQTEAPLLRSQLRKQDEKLQQQEKLLKEQGEALKELLDSNRESKALGWEYAIEQAEAQMEEAVENADRVAYRRFKQQRDDLMKRRPPLKDEKKPNDGKADGKDLPIDPEIEEWSRRNAWYTTDVEMNQWAVGASRKILADEPYLSTRERLEKVTELAKKRFPEKFSNPARSNPPAASRPGPQGTRPAPKKGKTEADLPPSARATMERLVRQKVLTKEQYLKDYKWGN